MAASLVEPLPDAIIHLDGAGNHHVIFTMTVMESTTAHEVFGRVDRAFRSGAKSAWVVLPNVEQVFVFTSPTAVRILTRADDLTGDSVIPGFRLPVADLFPPVQP